MLIGGTHGSGRNLSARGAPIAEGDVNGRHSLKKADRGDRESGGTLTARGAPIAEGDYNARHSLNRLIGDWR